MNLKWMARGQVNPIISIIIDNDNDHNNNNNNNNNNNKFTERFSAPIFQERA